jgi:hypothetical protein
MKRIRTLFYSDKFRTSQYYCLCAHQQVNDFSEEAEIKIKCLNENINFVCAISVVPLLHSD